MTQQGLNAYRRTEVQSRTPLELVVMLYDGALRFASAAREAIVRCDIPARRDATSRLLAIVSELQSTLDLQRGGEVAAELDRLYDYMRERITAAAVASDPSPLDEVRGLLATLRDAWQTIAQAPARPAPVESGFNPMVAAAAPAPAAMFAGRSR